MPTSKFKRQTLKRVAITSGDPAGIGFEVTAKALAKFKPKKNIIFFLFRDHHQEQKQYKYFRLIDKTWTRITFFSLDVALDFVSSLERNGSVRNDYLIDLSLRSSAADWVVEAASACLSKKLNSLVTGPLSKTLVKAYGYKELGHTGLFRTLCPKAELHMAFVGKDFHVLIATDHIQFSTIESVLTAKAVASALTNAKKLKSLLGSKKDIAVLGLNPHAGEFGLIGSFENRFLRQLPKGFRGPLVPDAAFLKKNWSKFSLYLALYHDQGLIPFKMHHGQDAGVHVTVGLPFVRTSVDHGTAFDIYNKNLANPNSMADAINLNLKLLSR